MKIVCPKCGREIELNYWKWVLIAPFHTFTKRYTKCPYCKQKSFMGRVKKNADIS